MKTSDTIQEDSESPKPVDEGEIQIEFSSDYLYCPDIWAVRNKQTNKQTSKTKNCKPI